VDYCDLGMIGE